MILGASGLGGECDHWGVSRVLSESLWDRMMGKQDRLQISGRLLAKNTLLNFIGQAVPLLVGVITIPFVVWGLGTDW